MKSRFLVIIVALVACGQLEARKSSKAKRTAERARATDAQRAMLAEELRDKLVALQENAQQTRALSASVDDAEQRLCALEAANRRPESLVRDTNTLVDQVNQLLDAEAARLAVATTAPRGDVFTEDQAPTGTLAVIIKPEDQVIVLKHTSVSQEELARLQRAIAALDAAESARENAERDGEVVRIELDIIGAAALVCNNLQQALLSYVVGHKKSCVAAAALLALYGIVKYDKITLKQVRDLLQAMHGAASRKLAQQRNKCTLL